MRKTAFALPPLARKPVTIWLYICVFIIFTMIVLGGVTRLAGAGLSIVEWRPVTGILPPLTQAEWLIEFAKYQSHSEYQTVNLGMSLSDFKFIFALEYLHRLWGRLIGFCFLIPFLYFCYRHWLPSKLKWRLFFFFCLGGTQGMVGWLMVKSGLQDIPQVSPYRLTLHLLLAVALLAGFFWTALQVSTRNKLEETTMKRQKKLFPFLLVWSLVTLTLGGLVAGHRAGLVYNTFPRMGENWLPNEILFLSPFWLNFVANPVTVQFLHRLFALALSIFVVGAWIKSLVTDKAHFKALSLVATAVLVQISLGIATLLYHVPLSLATLHQAGGVLVFLAILWGLFRSSFYSRSFSN